MITNTQRTYDANLIKRSRKDYYMVIIDHKPEGICTSFEVAQACAKCFAKKHDAKEIDNDDVYLYEDKDGKHLIYIEKIKRIRMPYELDKGDE